MTARQLNRYVLASSRTHTEPEFIITSQPIRRRPDFGVSWLNAMDAITARTRTLARLRNDTRYRGRIPGLTRTRGEIMMTIEMYNLRI